MHIKSAEFLVSNSNVAKCPKNKMPEYAFIGRSNVGKSSLINMLTDRKNLAKTSGRPGKTQLINHFVINQTWYLVDLPGYGYAKASKKAVQQWSELVRLYLNGRAQLRRVCLLVDSRHGLKDSDRNVMAVLDKAAVSYQVILTKCDKIKETALVKVVKRTDTELASHVAAHPKILPSSSVRGTGISELRAELTKLAERNNLR